MSEELKPCPFCGGEAEFKQTGRHELTLRCVGHQPATGLQGCGPKYVQKVLPSRHTLDWLRERMTKVWNTRADEATITALTKRAEEAEAGTVVREFGLGKLCVDTWTMGESYAVFISHAKQPGEIGASAKREGHPLDRLLPGVVVLKFPTEGQARSVADALVNALEDVSTWKARAEAAERRLAEAERVIADLLHSVCGEAGFANAVRTVTNTAYPWPALDNAESAARKWQEEGR